MILSGQHPAPAPQAPQAPPAAIARWLRRVLSATAWLLVGAGTSAAQSPTVAAPRTPAAMVAGTVVDSAGRAIRGALLTAPSGATARTDSRGLFAFTRVSVPTTLTVRAVGFQPRTVAVSVTTPLPLRIVLHRARSALDTVRVVDVSGCDPTSLAGFACRRRAGGGYFRDAAELRALRPVYWADMIDGFPGLRRRSTIGPNGPDVRMGTVPSQCLVELWNGQPAMMDRTAQFQADTYWLASDVVAIEFYDAYRKVPAQYRTLAWPADAPHGCQLIVYWLKGATRGNSGPAVAAVLDSLRRAQVDRTVDPAASGTADLEPRPDSAAASDLAMDDLRERAVATAIRMRIEWLGDLQPVDDCSVRAVLGRPVSRALLPSRLHHLLAPPSVECTVAPSTGATLLGVAIDPGYDCPGDRAFLVRFQVTDADGVRAQTVRVNRRRPGVHESPAGTVLMPDTPATGSAVPCR